ncbi:MAG: 3-deoxy-D-manno-octulosonic acid transferase [Sebaldella sp.]|nr:3-deoxy-D-manno-octulosonic acid transferase [Sebaldella sp.]
MIFIYNIIRFFLYPILLIAAVFNTKFRKFFLKRLKVGKVTRDKYIWIHLSSVGELNLSEKLIEKILDENKKIFITLMTDTGMETFNKRYSDNPNITADFFPLDDYFCIRKIVKMIDIEKLIIIETEIWPNLYNEVSKKAEIIVVNGRISVRTFKKYMNLRRFISGILNKCRKILVQSDLDFKRYEELGVKKDILKVYPNLKYSIDYPIIDEKNKEEIKENILYKDRVIIIAGSTRSGEDEVLLSVFKEINKENKYQLLLVPRHLKRIEEIEELLTNMDYSLYSENKKSEVVLVDKMGILRDLYQVSDIVFVGGTLVNVGGHSILEPLYYGKVPVIGNNYENIRDIVEKAAILGLVKVVNNEDELKNTILSMSSENIDTNKFFQKYNMIDEIMDEIFL